MSLNIEQKKQIIENVKKIALNTKSLVVANYSGTSAMEMTTLRRKALDREVEVSVIPNRLAKIAFTDTDLACINDKLKQPLVYFFSKKESSAAAKLLMEFKKDCESLEPVAIVVGDRSFEVSDLEMVSKLPTKEEAISMLLSCMKAPIMKLAQVTRAPVEKLVRTLDAVKASRNNG